MSYVRSFLISHLDIAVLFLQNTYALKVITSKKNKKNFSFENNGAIQIVVSVQTLEKPFSQFKQFYISDSSICWIFQIVFIADTRNWLLFISSYTKLMICWLLFTHSSRYLFWCFFSIMFETVVFFIFFNSRWQNTAYFLIHHVEKCVIVRPAMASISLRYVPIWTFFECRITIHDYHFSLTRISTEREPFVNYFF